MAITNIYTPWYNAWEGHAEYVRALLYFERIMKQDSQTKGTYNALHVIDESNKQEWMQIQREYLVPLLKCRTEKVKVTDDQRMVPPYIRALFDHFCDRMSEVNLSCIGAETKSMDESLRGILFNLNDDSECKVDILVLMVLFPNLQRYFDMVGQLVNAVRHVD